MDGEKGNAMAKSLRHLTVLLGKLDIGGDKFAVNHDAINKTHMFLGFPKGRPPWRTGIEYGVTLYRATAWVKKFIKTKVAKKFLEEHPLK